MAIAVGWMQIWWMPRFQRPICGRSIKLYHIQILSNQIQEVPKITMSAWVYRTQIQSFGKIIAKSCTNGPWSNPTACWQLAASSENNSPDPYVSVGDGITHAETSQQGVSSDMWVFVAGVFDGTSLTMKAGTNLRTVGVADLQLQYPSRTDVRIGASPGSSAQEHFVCEN